MTTRALEVWAIFCLDGMDVILGVIFHRERDEIFGRSGLNWNKVRCPANELGFFFFFIKQMSWNSLLVVSASLALELESTGQGGAQNFSFKLG